MLRCRRGDFRLPLPAVSVGELADRPALKIMKEHRRLKKKGNVVKGKEKGNGEHRGWGREGGTINYVASLSATRGKATQGTRVERRSLGPRVVPSSKHAP
ncbi:hypothetical protein COLO4_18915 [Corchorus olitorius]|uniref:Uncharacterized protein n=1 Tax=Corchorus olitorius TaxID=93759 RepID=A0A1R3J7D0_9ROSI|nr:hypothetical protein COLO4_18915 [Corchorus olitorius]